MPEEFKPGCARPTGGPVGEEPVLAEMGGEKEKTVKEEKKAMI